MDFDIDIVLNPTLEAEIELHLLARTTDPAVIESLLQGGLAAAAEPSRQAVLEALGINEDEVVTLEGSHSLNIVGGQL